MKRFNYSDKLRQILSRRVQTLTRKMIDEDGHFSKKELESLEEVSRLIDIYDKTQTELNSKRWLFPVLLLITVSLLSILLFARVSETEIELDIKVSEVAFTLPSKHILAESMQLSRLAIAGLTEIQVPRAKNLPRQTIHLGDGNGASLNAAFKLVNNSSSSLSLADLFLPAETRIGIQLSEQPNEYRLMLQAKKLELSASLFGTIMFTTPQLQTNEIYFTNPRAIQMFADSQLVDVSLTYPEQLQVRFASQLPANNVTLFRIVQFENRESSLVRKVSTILEGKLYFKSLNDKIRRLRPSEAINFRESLGEIRTIRLNDDYITLRYFGRVKGMEVGYGENRRSLMPTYLEWLSASHGLSLLWGATLYVFGLIVGVLRWWDKIK